MRHPSETGHVGCWRMRTGVGKVTLKANLIFAASAGNEMAIAQLILGPCSMLCAPSYRSIEQMHAAPAAMPQECQTLKSKC